MSEANQGQNVKNALRHTFELATAAYQNRQYDQAVSLYHKALDIYPSFAPAQYYLGMCYKNQGNAAEAIHHFQEAIRIDATHEASHDELSRIYYGLAQFDSAEEYAQKALEINPDNRSAELTLGWTYLMGKSMGDEAIAYFESAVDKQPVPFAYLGLGMAYYMTGQRAKVLETITFLRQSQKEEMALQLEAMIRDPSRISKVIPGEPLFSAVAEKKSRLIREAPPQKYPDVSSRESIRTMDVRLSAPFNRQGVPPNSPQLSGAERIRQMQQRRQKGSGY